VIGTIISFLLVGSGGSPVPCRDHFAGLALQLKAGELRNDILGEHDPDLLRRR